MPRCEGDLVILCAGVCVKDTTLGSMCLESVWIGHLNVLTLLSGTQFIEHLFGCWSPFPFMYNFCHLGEPVRRSMGVGVGMEELIPCSIQLA